jgi:hypothetical protein
MMMMDAKADLVALSRAWRMAIAGVREGRGADWSAWRAREW